MKNDETDLFHAGILGMKWGVRRNIASASRNQNKSNVKKVTGRKRVTKEEANKFIGNHKNQKVTDFSKVKQRAARLGKAASILITAYSVVSIATLLNPRFVGDIAWTTGKIISNTPLR